MAEIYPVPVFRFAITGIGKGVGFSEASGLNIETQPIEYRDGASPDFSVIKMPGMKKFSNITLKRGISKGNKEFMDWLKTISLNKVERRSIEIKLQDENGDPLVVWKLANAWPVKVDGPSLKSTGNEVAIESIELAHEGLTLEFK